MLKRPVRITGLFLLAFLFLAACGIPNLVTVRQVSFGDTPTPGAVSTTTASSTDATAIQNVIQKANQEQARAVARKNPALMQDTATSSYYQESVQTYKDLLGSGVTAIQLLKLDWGPINLTDANTAQATTYETWSTTFSEGSSMQETDRNVYTLVLQNGAWKVDDDQHPDSNTLQSSNPNGAPAPETPVGSVSPASGQDQSRNWAGYAATGGTFTSVSGSWVVPNVNSNTTGIDATWVGIGGVRATDLIQAGTQAIAQGRQVVYTAWWETLPQAAQTIPLAVNAGDNVNVSIAEQGSGAWLIKISDATNGQSWSKTLKYRSSLSSAEWVEEAPATGRLTILPLDQFGSVTFTSASTVENGQSRTIAQAGGTPIAMTNSAGQALALSSNLDASGSSFTVTRTGVTAPSLSPNRRRRFGNGG